jgi:superfamily II RNA helicase
MILTPPRIRMLLLSATIGNARELARWIEELRGVRCGVVTRPGDRPVPLRAAFLLPDKRLVPLLGANGKLNREISSLIEETGGKGAKGKLATLRSFSLLPFYPLPLASSFPSRL